MTAGGISSVQGGRSAERRAANWLRLRGYRILATNYRVRGGELDLVALDGDTLCFVEVKARGDGSWFGALESLGRGQLRRIVHAARLWLLKHPHDGPCRFDIVTLDGDDAGNERIEHLPNAFDLDDL